MMQRKTQNISSLFACEVKHGIVTPVIAMAATNWFLPIELPSAKTKSSITYHTIHMIEIQSSGHSHITWRKQDFLNDVTQK